jgi:hypothetical protein
MEKPERSPAEQQTVRRAAVMLQEYQQRAGGTLNAQVESAAFPAEARTQSPQTAPQATGATPLSGVSVGGSNPEAPAVRGSIVDAARVAAQRARTGARDLFGLIDDETASRERQNINLAEAQMRLERRQQIRNAGGDPDSLSVRANLGASNVLGTIIPELPLAIIGPGATGRLFGQFNRAGRFVQSTAGRVGGEGLAGVQGGLATQVDDNTSRSAMLGLSLGTGLGFAVEIPGIARRGLMNAATDASAAQRQYAAQNAIESTQIRMSLTEMSGDQRVALYESAIPNVPGSARAQFRQDQVNDVLGAMVRFNDALNPDNLSTSAIIRETRNAFEGHVSAIQDNASVAFRERLRPAMETVGARFDERGGGRILEGNRVVMPDNMMEELNIVYQQTLEMGGNAPSGFLKTLEDQLETVGQDIADGGLRLGTVQQMLSDLSDMAYGKGGVVDQALSARERIHSRGMLDALVDDLGAAADNMEDPAGEAANALRAARDEYKTNIAALNELQGEAMTQLLGKVGADPSSATFVKRLLEMEDGEYMRLMRMADESRPGLANAIRGRQYIELINAHTTPTGFGEDLTIDFAGLVGQLDDMGLRKQQAFLGTHIDTPTMNRVDDAFKILRAIGEGPRGGEGVRGMIQRTEAYFINAISQNPGFMGRLAAGELSPGFYERMLYTPEGLNTLARIGDPKATRATITSAVNTMVNWQLQADKRRQEYEAAQEQQRQQNMQNEQPGRMR